MSLVDTKYEHVTLNEKGAPVIAGTTMKVVELVSEKIAYGWSPEELHFQHPYLTMGQIHSSLAYYFDHEDELNKDVEHRLQCVQKYRPSEKTLLAKSNFYPCNFMRRSRSF
ncbi:MAG: DUF433 domain-containing protein [Nitrospirota bacterium]